MPLQILGMATALPDYALPQSLAARQALRLSPQPADQHKWLAKLYQRSGVERRGSVLLEPGSGNGPAQSFYAAAVDGHDRGPTTARRMDRYSVEAPRLACRAAGDALQRAALEPQSVTHVVTVSCTGFEAPGFDAALIERLPLRPTVSRTHVGFMGCHGVLNALRVARAYVEADPHAFVLVCAVELCSLHFQYGRDPQHMVANALFADGAAALVGVAGDRPPSDPAAGWQVAANGSCMLPDSAQAMTWRIGDHGFVMTLAKSVPGLIRRHLGPWLDGWLAELGLQRSQIGSWAIHPGGPSIVTAVAGALELPDAAVQPSRQVLAESGNMSSPTVLFILERLQKARADRPCVALGFGPGLAVEAALLT